MDELTQDTFNLARYKHDHGKLQPGSVWEFYVWPDRADWTPKRVLISASSLALAVRKYKFHSPNARMYPIGLRS